MGSLDFLQPSEVAYPTGSGPTSPAAPPCGAPYQPPEPDGFVNKYLNPKQLPYPTSRRGYRRNPSCPPKGPRRSSAGEVVSVRAHRARTNGIQL